MIIASYICTILNYILYCASRFIKEKKTMLLLDIIAKILTITGLYLLGSMSGSYSFIIALAALVLIRLKQETNILWNLGYGVIQALYIIVMIWQFEGVSSVLIFISSSLMLFANWFLETQGIRKVGIIVSILYLAYQISIQNWAGLLEIFVLTANIVSFVKYKKVEHA